MSKEDSPLKDATAGELFTELLKRIDFDGADPRTFSLAELYRAAPGARWPDHHAIMYEKYKEAEELYKGETRWNIIKIGLYLLLVLWLAWAAGQ